MINSSFNKIAVWKPLLPWVGTVILFPAVVYYTLNGGKFTFIDYVNLLIHEGGHGIFRILGKFLYTLGGTLMQLIIPGMFVVYYFINKKIFGTQIFLVWLGENLLNISVYASDARAQRLPLLGGNKVYHDWNWLLTQTGLLEYDHTIGWFFYITGVIVFVAALLAPLVVGESTDSKLNLDL
ncbi:MAG: hypothetical protein CVV24_00130 [Ignavibacteriae bacterium HGW-Ignavibacteriae-3]|nr:MAG: hypothetical protein CVV24_00130 [Ignavibacteriae bacterium HGW-Ignavibacteriae-3]